MPSESTDSTDTVEPDESTESNETTASVPTPKGFEDCEPGETLEVVSNEDGTLTFRKGEDYEKPEEEMPMKDKGAVAVVIASRAKK